jgi:GNAT superfamily N-acetyltransferase
MAGDGSRAGAMGLPRDVDIRPATLRDLDTIVNLWMAMMHEHASFDPRVRLSESAEKGYRQYARHYIARSDATVFIAEHDREVVGFCLAYRAQNLPMFCPEQYGYLSDLVVRNDWRGRGIGSALFQKTRGWFRDRQITHVQLQVYSLNADGMTFWKKMGLTDFVCSMRLEMEP